MNANSNIHIDNYLMCIYIEKGGNIMTNMYCSLCHMSTFNKIATYMFDGKSLGHAIQSGNA